MVNSTQVFIHFFTKMSFGGTSEMIIQACDHSRQDAVVSVNEEWVHVVPAGFVHGRLTPHAEREIKGIRDQFAGDLAAFSVVQGRFSRDIADHDTSTRIA